MARSIRFLSLVSALAAVISAACAETPLDATLLEAGGQTTGTSAPLCPTATPEEAVSYLLVSKSTGACLEAGTITQIEQSTSGATGRTVELNPLCQDIAEQRWTLMAESFGEWSIRNEAFDLNLDLEGGRFFDDTEALLYTAHAMSNQRFSFVARGPDDYQIRASILLTDNSCLQSMVDQEDAVTLQGCSAAPSQLWLLSPSDCD